MIHVRFLNAAVDDEAAARLGRLLAGNETEDDLATLAPPKAGAGRDPRTMPGWRKGFKPVGQGGSQAVTVGAPSERR